MKKDTSSHDPRFEEHLDYELKLKKEKKWKSLILLGIVSISLLFMATLNSIFPWLRILFAIIGSALGFYCLFYMSMTKYGKGGWSGPWFGDGPF